MTDPNVWTINAAVDEVMRQRLRLVVLWDRERRLRNLVTNWREQAEDPDMVSEERISLVICADQLEKLLLGREDFTPKEADYERS